MLSQENRLDIRTYYSEIRGHGKKVFDPYFSLYYRQQNDTPPRLNTIISKKISKAATKRNRMRRLIHQAAQELIPQIKLGFDGLFFVHKDFSQESSTTITQKIKEMLIYAKIYQEPLSQ